MQRWANNSVFEYYLNTWGQILVFVFGDLLKPNIIRIRMIFSNRISFVFVVGYFFKPNIIPIRNLALLLLLSQKMLKMPKSLPKKVKAKILLHWEIWCLNWNFNFFGLDVAIFNTDPVKKTTLQLHVIDNKRNVTLLLCNVYVCITSLYCLTNALEFWYWYLVLFFLENRMIFVSGFGHFWEAE